jgi:hypothetical protein
LGCIVGLPMAYLQPPFDPDVFVSYSHCDPVGGRAPLRDWSQALIRRLKYGLHALETEFYDLDIWRDRNLPDCQLDRGTERHGQFRAWLYSARIQSTAAAR